MIPSPIAHAIKKGVHSRNISFDGIFAIDEQIKTNIPTGGVSDPSTELMTMITPRWIGSTPTESINGTKSGTMINMIGITSRNVPATNIKTLISNKSCHGSWTNALVQAISICGICSAMRIHAKGTDTAIRKPISALSMAHSAKSS